MYWNWCLRFVFHYLFLPLGRISVVLKWWSSSSSSSAWMVISSESITFLWNYWKLFIVENGRVTSTTTWRSSWIFCFRWTLFFLSFFHSFTLPFGIWCYQSFQAYWEYSQHFSHIITDPIIVLNAPYRVIIDLFEWSGFAPVLLSKKKNYYSSFHSSVFSFQLRFFCCLIQMRFFFVSYFACHIPMAARFSPISYSRIFLGSVSHSPDIYYFISFSPCVCVYLFVSLFVDVNQ